MCGWIPTTGLIPWNEEPQASPWAHLHRESCFGARLPKRHLVWGRLMGGEPLEQLWPDHPRGCCRRLCWVGTMAPTGIPVLPGCCHSPSPRSPLPGLLLTPSPTPGPHPAASHHLFHPVEETFPGMEFVSLCFHPSWPCCVPRGRAGIWLGRGWTLLSGKCSDDQSWNNGDVGAVGFHLGIPTGKGC